MSPEDPRWKRKRPDINEPVPLTEEPERIEYLRRMEFKDFKPMRKRKSIFSKVRTGETKDFNKGTL